MRARLPLFGAATALLVSGLAAAANGSTLRGYYEGAFYPDYGSGASMHLVVDAKNHPKTVRDLYFTKFAPNCGSVLEWAIDGRVPVNNRNKFHYTGRSPNLYDETSDITFTVNGTVKPRARRIVGYVSATADVDYGGEWGSATCSFTNKHFSAGKIN